MDQGARLQKFEEIRQRYSNFLTAVIWKLTVDEDLFTDAMQNALLQIWRYLDKLDGPYVATYLYRISKSSVSIARKNRLGNQQELPGTLVDRQENPDNTIDNQDLFVKVQKAMDHLPRRQHQVITMRYLQQFSYEDIARDLGIRESAARSMVSKALSRLKKTILRKIEV
jgi:RNA polymerase sigma-70 factor, ECF subfamily